VRVRNLRNNCHIDVRINGRFPIETLRKGRVVDVSYAAARRLDKVRDGVVTVEVTVRAWP
jgi:rare lipoprotein A